MGLQACNEYDSLLAYIIIEDITNIPSINRALQHIKETWQRCRRTRLSLLLKILQFIIFNSYLHFEYNFQFIDDEGDYVGI